MKVMFERNIYYPNETANAVITIDNSKSVMDIKSVDLIIEQNVELYTDRKDYKQTFTILQSSN